MISFPSLRRAYLTTTNCNRRIGTSISTMSSIQGLRWDLSPAEIKSATEKIIQRSKNVLDSVAQLPQDKVSFDSVIRPLAEEEALQSTESTNIDFP